MYNELGWESLQEHRHNCKQRLRVFDKSIHGDAPLYLQQIIPNREEHHGYHVHKETNFIQLSKTRTSQFQNSFLPKTISDWNKRTNEVKLSMSLETFTNHLENDKAKIPSWFYSGNRRFNIIHT